ncbi:hypothetical protein RRG08_017284 [Elysia crispata]|uniref:Uncharacterized protein n=1 Tax=Elysia crispata TaxID=231223 RepID=A0AAE0YPJ9_9GAST|nr:hypothetical protein RRG08_017284 [Elysia crispata]
MRQSQHQRDSSHEQLQRFQETDVEPFYSTLMRQSQHQRDSSHEQLQRFQETDVEPFYPQPHGRPVLSRAPPLRLGRVYSINIPSLTCLSGWLAGNSQQRPVGRTAQSVELCSDKKQVKGSILHTRCLVDGLDISQAASCLACHKNRGDRDKK